MSRCFPSKSGFSLAEVTLALGIAGFCLVAVFGLMPVGVQTNRNATSQTAATNIVAAVVADLRATPNTINTSSQFAITFGTNKTLYFDGSGQAANSAAHVAVTETWTNNRPALTRADVARLVSVLTNSTFTANEETKETIARALAELGQTRTWNLFIDVIAQSGRYPPNAASFENGFVVVGEQRYWVHVAIDRFTGRVIDKQIEVVNE